LGYNFPSCTELTIDGTTAKAVRGKDGGKETVGTYITINYWWSKKKLVREKTVLNMRGIMTARTKPLTVRPIDAAVNTKAVRKPAPKSAVK
jgi:electron transfer flavoprotein beta subunit